MTEDTTIQIGSKFVNWDIYGTNMSIKRFEAIIKRIYREKEERPITREESDIIIHCPIQPDNYTLTIRGDKLNIILNKQDGYTLYGIESWIPFMARFFEGSFKVQGMEDDDKWGVDFLGDGRYRYLESTVKYEIYLLDTDIEIESKLDKITR